jgi:predicted dehydrogenase
MGRLSTYKILSPPVRWGIIGCGNVCEVKSGPAFYKSRESSVTAVMRRDAGKAADFARRHGIGKCYSDASRLIEDADVDAVYIATPPSSHAEYAIRAMRAGKPVYVEKPMAASYSECEEMNRVSAETGVPLFVAYYRRCLPYFLKVKELVDNGETGTLRTARVCFRSPPHVGDYDRKHLPWRVQPEISGGGYFYDMACHTLDILDFILGEIEDAKGFAANVAGLYDVEDTVTASFRFSSGVVASGEWAYAAPKSSAQDTVEIIGSKGSIRFATFSFTPIVFQTSHEQSEYAFPRPEHIQQHMVEAVVSQLCGKGLSPSDGISAARANKVMDMIIGD